MRSTKEPVRGRWVAIAPCEQCGRLLADDWYMHVAYPRQQWGQVSHNAPRNKAGWFSSRTLCHDCKRRDMAEQRRQKRERLVRNCVVCGDPFRLYTKLRVTNTGNLTCANPRCRNEAGRVFNQSPFRGVYPRKLRERAMFSLLNNAGDIYYPQVLFAICKLLRLGRDGHAENHHHG